jgi:hypothetical protein
MSSNRSFYVAGSNREEKERDRGRQTDRETELTIEIPGKFFFFMNLCFDTMIYIYFFSKIV